MAQLLTEIAKGMQDELRRGIILKYVQGSQVLRDLPLFSILGNSYSYNLQDTLPGVKFRGYNETYTHTPGLTNPISEPLTICGGLAQCDRALKAVSADDPMASEIEQLLDAQAKMFDYKFINGDQADDPREFDGLYVRVNGGSQEFHGHADGLALSTKLLNLLCTYIIGGVPSVIYMNPQIFVDFQELAKGTCTWQPDAFGDLVLMWQGRIPIRVLDKDNEGTAILPQTEECGSSGAVCSSVYAVRFGGADRSYLQGFQNAPPAVGPLVQGTVADEQAIEWLVGLAAHHGQSIARLEGVKLAT